MEQAILKAFSNKYQNMRKTYSDNQHIFILFVFDIFSFLISQTNNAKAYHNNVLFPRTINIVFKTILFLYNFNYINKY